MIALRRLCCPVAVLSIAASCSGAPPGAASGQVVSQAEFGDDWPLTVESGVVSCVPPGAVVFTAGGITYSLNGLAVSMSQNRGWFSVDQIWSTSEDPYGGPKKSLGGLIDMGRSLCD